MLALSPEINNHLEEKETISVSLQKTSKENSHREETCADHQKINPTPTVQEDIVSASSDNPYDIEPTQREITTLHHPADPKKVAQIKEARKTQANDGYSRP